MGDRKLKVELDVSEVLSSPIPIESSGFRVEDHPTAINLNRSLTLVPLRPCHYEALFELETADAVHLTYRLAGRTPSPDQFVDLLWAGVEVHMVVATAHARHVALGSIAMYNWSATNQTAYVAVVVDPELRMAGTAMILMARFVHHCFQSYPLRKIYFEATQSTLEQFRSGLRTGLLTLAAEIDQHVYVRGRFESYFILSVERSQFYSSALARRYVPDANSGKDYS